MSPLLVSAFVLACTFGATLLAVLAARLLPTGHLTGASKETIHAIMGIMALLAAVVLGLLIYSAKTSFDTKDTEFRHASAKVVLLDRVLAHYGPDAGPARGHLREAVQRKLAALNPKALPADHGSEATFVAIEAIQDEIRGFQPTTDAQRWLKDRALAVSSDIAEARWFLLDDLDSTMPMPFLVVLVFWLALIFFSHGLFAPPNVTVLSLMLFCAVSLSAAIYLMLEMNNSLEGPISISTEPLGRALERLGR
ncbi:hypothetical protein [Hyphomicrobium sp. CS1GBMeth3]|uniref:bestrophin-like domain n=1 Tax=Hyphomicrobium sp. CS1GBMeth3 TaxID=1892845 RepID=UPI00093169C4|nr:hypothetical protein [Hyphomicrobium sp. CS1GBMeth3]